MFTCLLDYYLVGTFQLPRLLFGMLLVSWLGSVLENCFISCSKVSRLVVFLTLRRLMSYISMEHPFLMFLDHTQRRSTVGRTPLDE